jgi:hypothetical protein
MDTAEEQADTFQVPDETELPAELTGATPRPIPDSVQQSHLAQRHRNIFWGLLTAGTVCGLLAPVPFVNTLALYILPLGYLFWIALGLLAFAVVGHFSQGELKKACRYIEEGEASIARVKSLVKTPTSVVNDQTTTYAFAAGLQMQQPESGEVIACVVKSRDFSESQKNLIDTNFRVGDYVPVVWLPNKFVETLQIYDFLDITPSASLVRQEDKPTPLWQVLAILVLVVGLFFALFWNLYAFSRFEPIEFDWVRQGTGALLGGGAVGLIAIIVAWRISKKKGRELADRNVDALQSGAAVELQAESSAIGGFFWGLILLFGAMLLCGATMLCWCWTANSLLDQSAPEQRPVQITEMVQVTHAFLFREYKLEYRFHQDQDERSMLTTPRHLSQFHAPLGVAVIRKGWFGWPWVETIEPVLLINKEAPVEAAVPVE